MILDNAIELAMLPVSEGLFATHAQRDEIEKTPEPFRRKRLLRVFELVATDQIPTAGAVWGISRWDHACWDDGTAGVDAMITELTRLDKEAGRSVNNANVFEGIRRDILIAITAIRRGLTLVTDDARLSAITQKFGGNVCSFDGLLKIGHAR